VPASPASSSSSKTFTRSGGPSQRRRPSRPAGAQADPGRHLPLIDPDTKGGQPVTALAVSGRGAPAHPAGSTARLAWHQFHYDLRAFFRNRQARFFTLARPVLFLLVFASVFTGTTKVAGGSIETSLYYVPGIITLAISSAAFGNLGPRPGPLLLHT
jgi:hypothetical protein